MRKAIPNYRESVLIRTMVKYPLRVILLVTLFVYANTLFNDYNLDDELVTRNHRLTARGFEAIGDIFREPYYKDAMGYSYEYRPIVLLTFAIEHQFLGEHAFVSHLINLLFYLALLATLYKTLLVLFGGISQHVIFTITLLYALHPIHTEVVASIKCRDEILAHLGGLLSLFYALKFVDTTKWYFLPVSLAMLILGCLSKQSIVSFVVLIPIAIALFRSPTFLKFLFLLSSFGIIVYPILNVEKAIDKFLFILAGLIFSIGIYFLKRIDHGQLLTYIRNVGVVKKNDLSHYGLSLKSKIELFKKEGQQFKLRQIVIPVVVSVVFICSFQTVSNNILLFSLVACYLLAVFALYRQQSLLFAFPITVFVIYNLSGPTSGTKDVIRITEILLLSMTIMAGNKFETILSLVLYLALYVFVIVNNSASLSLKTFFFIPMFWAAWTYRSKYVVAVCGAFFLLLVSQNGIDFFKNQVPLKDALTTHLSFGALLASIALVNRAHYRWAVFVNLTLILALVATNPAFQVRNSDAVSISDISNGLVSTVDRTNVSVFPENIDRPLHYAEVPVTWQNDRETRLGTSFYILLKYLQLAVVPYPMSFYYGYAVIKPVKIFQPLPVTSIVVYSFLGITAFVLLRTYTILSFGILFYLVSISVFSSYFVYMPGMMADRNMFIPSLGYCIVLVLLLVMFLKSDLKTFDLFKLSTKWKYGILMLFLGYGMTTIARNFDWKDDLTLFRHDIKYVTESSQAHNLLALHLMQYASKDPNPSAQQQLATEALTHFKRAIEIYPPFFNVAYDIGRVYSFLNMPDSAIVAFENALAIDSSALPNLHLQLSDLYLNEGDRQKAIEHTERYINVNKNDYSGYSRLSYIYFTDKKYNESIEVNERAMVSLPNLIDPYINVAYTYREMKIPDSALYYLRLAEKIDPSNRNVQLGIKQLTEIETVSR